MRVKGTLDTQAHADSGPCLLLYIFILQSLKHFRFSIKNVYKCAAFNMNVYEECRINAELSFLQGDFTSDVKELRNDRQVSRELCSDWMPEVWGWSLGHTFYLFD